MRTILILLMLSSAALCARSQSSKKPMKAESKVKHPTQESALAADQELAKAMRENDTTALYLLLDKDWAVIAGTGDVVEGPSVFPSGIKSGFLTRKTFEISEPRVRQYGNTALVTTKVKLSGIFGGKPFDVMERQTDIWQWKDGAWKCVLTHETMLKEKPEQH